MLLESLFSGGVLLFVGTVLLCYVVLYYAKALGEQWTGKVPPGPLGLPLVGMLPFLRADFHRHIEELQRKYGPVFQMQVGTETSVFLADSATAFQFFKNPALNGREDRAYNIDKFGWGMFFRQDDAHWKMSRKLGMKAMTLLSASKASKVSQAVNEGLEVFYASMEKQEGKPLNVRDDIFNVTGCIITSLCFGVEADLEDPDTRKIFHFVSNDLSADYAALIVLNDMPALRPFYAGRLRRQAEGLREMTDFAMKLLDQHTFDGEVRTIADAVKKAAAEAEEADLRAAGVTREDMLKVAIDLMTAGMFDVGENIVWSLVQMAAHPDAQQRVHREVQGLTGGSRAVEAGDQSGMPFTLACATETLRFSASNPFNLAHRTTAPVLLHDWHIPAGVNVYANVYVMHRDPKLFPEPEQFLPERFVAEDGSFRTDLANKLIGFGAGGRRCIGEVFAKQELFIALANVVRRFAVHLDPDTPGDPLEHQFNFVLSPGPHKLIFRRRQ